MTVPFAFDVEAAKFPAYNWLTPDERAALEDDGKIHPTRWFRRKNWGRIAGIIIFLVAVILMDVYQKTIVRVLEPTAHWMHDTRGGFLVPFFLAIILCIPPLLGIEIVLILVGLAWNLGIGSLIGLSAVFVGELLTFYLFKYVARGRAVKLEEKDVNYAILGRSIRDGGIKMACVARYSVIPAHLLTALFSTCGVSLWTFVVSAVISLPRPFSAVLVGYSLGLTAHGHSALASAVVNNVALGISVVTTLASGWYMARKQQQIKVEVIRDRCERRMQAQGGFGARDESMELLVPKAANATALQSTDSFMTEVPSMTEVPPIPGYARV